MTTLELDPMRTLRPQRTSGRGITAALVDEKRLAPLSQPLGHAAAPTPAERAALANLRVVVAYDHWGRQLGPHVARTLSEWGAAVSDRSAGILDEHDRLPYGICALPALVALSRGDVSRAILICGNGVGMQDFAQRWPGAVATLATSVHAAKSGRRAHDSNVLCLGARLLKGDRLLTDLILRTFLFTDYEGLASFYAEQGAQADAWAAHAAKRGAELCLTDYAEVLEDFPALIE